MNKKPIGYLACFALGFIFPSCSHTDRYKIKDNTITYENATPRPIQVIDNRIIVGTLEQRMVDLTLENPRKVKHIAEQIINAELYNNKH